MFERLLIANRGEIACRIAHTARRLGISTVAVCSAADRTAQHVAVCDQAVEIGGPAAADSYLNIERLLAAARRTGAQAVHPGYGFLSERAEFAEACEAAGLIFVGPPAAAIRAMGSKAEAKRLMEQAGVPLVPGYHGEDNDPARLLAEAVRLGFPVLIKAVAGGGGRGMRRVDRVEDFAAALSACQREAQAGFGNPQVLLERHLLRPRHVEVQIFADRHGHCLHLHERDCSVQRRHQKVLEEAPAPGLPEALRSALGSAAIAAARSVGYVGAGTVEFMVEPDPQGALAFHFMEMNTRLQVEHPVTEAITGLDLVEWQLRVAAGEALPLTQAEVRRCGHAIEARLCAEDPDQGFLPSSGPLELLRWPEARRFQASAADSSAAAPAPLRIDTGVREGDAVSPWYDSMIAKVIAWGADREQARARLQAALEHCAIAGVHTNLGFLVRLVDSASFRSADLDTALIEREQAGLFPSSALPPRLALAGAVAHRLAALQAAGAADPWSAVDGWRLQGRSALSWQFDLGDQRWQVRLERPGAGDWQLRCVPTRKPATADQAHAVGEIEALLRIDSCADGSHRIWLDQCSQTVQVHAAGADLRVIACGQEARVTPVDPLARATDTGPAGRLSAPMPGRVLALLVQVGDRVSVGQPVAVVEAMKMEHTLHAPHAGQVSAILRAPGDPVAEGAELLQIRQE